MKVYFDPLDSAYKSVSGAVACNKPLKLKIKISDAKRCHLILRYDENGLRREIEMTKVGEYFRVEIDPLTVGLYWYCFIADGRKIGKNYYGFGELGEYTGDFELLVYNAKQTYPTSFCGGIMYQILPDRFAKAEGFGDSSGKRMRQDWGGIPEFLPRDGEARTRR